MVIEYMEGGEPRTAIPEPFWIPGWRHSWRTMFRWVPACYDCRITFSAVSEYQDHYVKHHLFDEAKTEEIGND